MCVFLLRCEGYLTRNMSQKKDMIKRKCSDGSTRLTVHCGFKGWPPDRKVCKASKWRAVRKVREQRKVRELRVVRKGRKHQLCIAQTICHNIAINHTCASSPFCASSPWRCWFVRRHRRSIRLKKKRPKFAKVEWKGTCISLMASIINALLGPLAVFCAPPWRTDGEAASQVAGSARGE